MQSISVRDFAKELKSSMANIAAVKGWNPHGQPHSGWIFQNWLARVITKCEPGLEDGDPEEACLYSQDLGVDIFFEDPDRQHLTICQAKYQAQDACIKDGEVNDFFMRHDKLKDRAWVRKHGSERTKDLLLDYGEKMAGGYSATYMFFSSGKATDRTMEAPSHSNAVYAERGVPITCEVYDFTKLKEYYIQSLSLEHSGPDEVDFQLPTGRFFEMEHPLHTLVAVLKGNKLRDLFKKHRESLYAWNIRGYLGSRGINSEILATAENRPEHFFYFNNGVSAICTKFEVAGNHLRAKNLQIINGAQTVTTLARAAAHEDIDVLFRLTQAATVKTADKGMNRDIIKYNNTQNAIKVSDFRSNDPIQIWLEKHFKQARATPVIQPVTYLPKRGARRGTGLSFRLEEFAKIRYSFLFEPTLVHASPKMLWTLGEDGGAYDRAFGVDGVLQSVWSDETFAEARLAISYYVRIQETTRAQAQKNSGLRFMSRLRFHALSLAGIFHRTWPSDFTASELLLNKTKFDARWQTFWAQASTLLPDTYSDLSATGTTMFAFLRGDERWRSLAQKFALRLQVAAAGLP